MHALNTLGEYKWRYRVVDEGGSPREEAIAALEESRSLIEDFAEVSARRRRPRVGAARLAPELADAVARARPRSAGAQRRSRLLGDKTIEALDVPLRELRDQAKMVETLNRSAR